MNNIDVFVYEAAVLVLGAALLYMSLTLRSLTKIAGEKKAIWVFPFVSAVILLVSLGLHAYANFALIPGMEEMIQSLSSDEAVFDSRKLEKIKSGISKGRETILTIKAVSFTCFFIASLFLLIPNIIYMRWITK